MAIRQIHTPFQIAILKQAMLDFKRKYVNENDILALYVFAMAYALEFAIPVPHLPKSTSKSENRPPCSPSASPSSSPKASSELPHKVLWELCVCVSVGCFLTIISIQLMSWFARLLRALSLQWLTLSPSSVKIRLRFTGTVIVGNMVLRSFLTHLPDSGWHFVLLVPVLIHFFCFIGTKLAGRYFESTVPEYQDLNVFLALHEGGYPVCTASPTPTANLPPPPPPPPSTVTLQPTPPPARSRSSPASLLRQQVQ